MSSLKRYDVFIAHAGSDIDAAEQLYSLLHPQLRVFLDSKCLLPGDPWDTKLPEAQDDSEITVVLISARTDKAYYQREEIAAAIDLARNESQVHRVVPVYLEGVPHRTVPFGLRRLHQLVVSQQTPLEAIAAQLIDLHRILTTESPSGTVEEQTPSVKTPTPKTQAELIDDLFSRNPAYSLPAAEALRELGPGVVRPIVERLGRGVNHLDVLAVRSVLAAFPEESGELLLAHIFAADKDWGAASRAVSCLSPAHRPACGDRLADRLGSGSVEVTRFRIEALGHIGAQEWGHRLVELEQDWFEHDHDLLQKTFSYALPAVGRMLVLSGGDAVENAWTMPTAFTYVEALVAIADEAPTYAFAALRELYRILAGCAPRHADHLITAWLRTDKGSLPLLAAHTLGNMGLHRALPHLVQVAETHGAGPVGHAARRAIGGIGGPEACDTLAIMTADPDSAICSNAREALALCVAEARDEAQFQTLARDLFTHDLYDKCWVYRAVGRRHDERFTTEIYAGLHDAEPTVRSHSALALARLQGGSCQDKLLHAYRDAGTPMERVFTALALLTIGTVPPPDPDLQLLQKDLAEESHLYKWLSQDDIIEVLEASEHPAAPAAATAWRSVYATIPMRY